MLVAPPSRLPLPLKPPLSVFLLSCLSLLIFGRSAEAKAMAESGASAAAPAAPAMPYYMAPVTPASRAQLGTASAEEAKYTLPHGYALEPAEDGTGGWLGHRSDVDTPGSGPGDDWVRPVVFDEDGEYGASLSAAAAFPPLGAHRSRVLLRSGFGFRLRLRLRLGLRLGLWLRLGPRVRVRQARKRASSAVTTQPRAQA